MFGWLYKGIAKAVTEDLSQYIVETMKDPEFHEQMTKLIDYHADRQKQRIYGSIGAAVRDNSQRIPQVTPQLAEAPNGLPLILNKEGEPDWGKTALAVIFGQPQRTRTQQRPNQTTW